MAEVYWVLRFFFVRMGVWERGRGGRGRTANQPRATSIACCAAATSTTTTKTNPSTHRTNPPKKLEKKNRKLTFIAPIPRNRPIPIERDPDLSTLGALELGPVEMDGCCVCEDDVVSYAVGCR